MCWQEEGVVLEYSERSVCWQEEGVVLEYSERSVCVLAGGGGGPGVQ